MDSFIKTIVLQFISFHTFFPIIQGAIHSFNRLQYQNRLKTDVKYRQQN